MTLATLKALSISSSYCRFGAWATSSLFHGLCVGFATFLIMELQPPPRSEPIKLDITMMEPAPRIQEISKNQDRPTPAHIRKEIVSEKPVAPTPAPQPLPKNKPIIQNQNNQPAMKTRAVHHSKPIHQPFPEPVKPVHDSRKMVRPKSAEIQQQVQVNSPLREVTAPSHKKDGSVKERPAPRVHQRMAAAKRPVQFYPGAQADYGWLAAAIWQQIEKYKSYPTQARQREWEGKVVLEAVIQQDGTILHLRVAETSGHGILDQNAMDVLWKVSPLRLDHPLDRPQITILVPLTYQLDG